MQLDDLLIEITEWVYNELETACGDPTFRRKLIDFALNEGVITTLSNPLIRASAEPTCGQCGGSGQTEDVSYHPYGSGSVPEVVAKICNCTGLE